MNPDKQTSRLNRLLKWLFPVLLLTEIVLLWSRALDAGMAAGRTRFAPTKHRIANRNWYDTFSSIAMPS